jgi:hypothetical protein
MPPVITLKANFEADLIAYARGQLIVRYGKKKINRIEDKNILIYFFDSRRSASALSRSCPPLLARTDPGILN